MNSVLIITNENQILVELQKILVKDYIIYNVNNTKEVLSLLKKHIEIEIVFLGANIEEKDYLHFLSRVSEDLKQRIILLGIYGKENDEGFLKMMIHNGVEDFVCYPFKPVVLLNRIKKILTSENYKRYSYLDNSAFLNKLEKERSQHLKELEEIQKQMKILLEQSQREGLTNLYNRRAFEEKVADLIQEGKEGCIMMVDIDDFKLINDIRGHVLGDKILIELANCFRNFIEEKGFVGRLGGDEFGFFLEGLKNEKEQLILQNELNKKVSEIGKKFNIDPALNVSIGLTCLTKNVKSFIDIYEVVDKMMYNNKIVRKQ